MLETKLKGLVGELYGTYDVNIGFAILCFVVLWKRHLSQLISSPTFPFMNGGHH
jgi:hypothetical protein